MKRRSRSHPDSRLSGDEPRRDPPIEAYLDARGRGRSARNMLDEVARDCSTLDELARDREWIDAVRAAPAAPDQTRRILDRLGFETDHSSRARWRRVLLTRRLVTAASLSLAFVVGMWARSASTPQPAARTAEAAHRFEQVIESLPMAIDPLERVRGMVSEVGATLTGTNPQNVPPAVAPESSRPHRSHRHFDRGARQAPPFNAESLFNSDATQDDLLLILRHMGVV